MQAAQGTDPLHQYPHLSVGLWLSPYSLWHFWLRKKEWRSNEVQCVYLCFLRVYTWQASREDFGWTQWTRGKESRKSEICWLEKPCGLPDYHFPCGPPHQGNRSLTFNWFLLDLSSMCLNNILLYWFFRFRYKLLTSNYAMRIWLSRSLCSSNVSYIYMINLYHQFWLNRYSKLTLLWSLHFLQLQHAVYTDVFLVTQLFFLSRVQNYLMFWFTPIPNALQLFAKAVIPLKVQMCQVICWFFIFNTFPLEPTSLLLWCDIQLSCGGSSISFFPGLGPHLMEVILQ